jgi:AAA+ superfamily predicted ATPase
MNPDFLHHLRSLTRITYVLTDEEDRFILQFREAMKKHEARTWVYNAAFGLQPIANIPRSWETQKHDVNQDCANIHDALIKVYTDEPRHEENFYIFTDPDRWLREEQVQRRVLNIIHQLHNDTKTVKMIVFVGSKLFVPEKLQRYVQVVRDTGLTPEETDQVVQKVCAQVSPPGMSVVNPPAEAATLFRGLTSYEIDEAITQSVTKTKKDDVNPRRVDPDFVVQYKRGQLKKTDLVQFIDTSDFNLEHVGGLHRFKRWAKETAASWTKEGQAFGLKPPRGVMLMGIYGCGKSLSVKALARLWGLPLVQFELGKMMSSGVGESEGNLYRALRLIEGCAPAIVWVDEAEKSLAGAQSSGRSDAGTTSRVLGILSTWVQETKAPVTLAMTANSLKTMPPEMTNRMGDRFFFDLPGEEDRIDILKIHLQKNGQNPGDYQLADLATASNLLVGREIEQAIEAAMIKSFNAKKGKLDGAILENELKRKPRIVKTMSDDIAEILSWVGYDKEADDGIRARLASDYRSELRSIVGGEK